MSEVFYTEKKLKSMKLMKVITEGPFSMNKWLEFCKSSSNIPDDFKSKDIITDRYPHFFELTVKTYIYNDNCERNVIKKKFKICERKSEKIDNKEKDPKENDTNLENKSQGKFKSEKFTRFNNSEGKGGFKIYKPKQFKSMNVSNDNFENSRRNSGKQMRSDRSNSSNMYSIVIKNLPNDYCANNLKNELQVIFSEYVSNKFSYKGRVCKTSVLTSNNVVKGVAFVDFYNKEHMESILSSTERFKVGFSILNIEKKNKN